MSRPTVSCRGTGRPGVTLVETLIGLVLAALVGSVVTGLLTAQLRLARSTAERAVAREALRTATAVLGAELRRMTPRDVRAIGPDSISVRALRGIAIPCGTTPLGTLVRYSGDRTPDPAKDSVLVVADDLETPLDLIDSMPATSSCAAPAGETILHWRIPQPPGAPAVLLLFESGSYHLTTRALRYRTGAGGRQPLTPEVLRHPATRFTALDSTGLRVDLDAGALRVAPRIPFPVPIRQ